MTDITFDTSQVDALAASLGEAGRKVTLDAAKVVLKTALDVERGMKKDFSGIRHAPNIPRAINHTVRGLEAEVGVDKRGPQGGLGNILAFGSSKNAAVVDHTAALRRETPAFLEFMGKLGVEAL